MAIDYKPEQNDYTNLTPFKTWLVNQINTWGINNFPFLEGDFDKLTNYGMLMKMMKCLNDIIANENLVEEDMSKLYGAFTELQNYINDYFDNLDVQEEINKKLDDMAQDGSLTTLISAYLTPYIDAQNNRISIIEGKVNSAVNVTPLVVSNINQMKDTTKIYVLSTSGHWYYYNGTQWVDGGVYQSTGLDINSVAFNNLGATIDKQLYKTNNIESVGWVNSGGQFLSSPMYMKKGSTITVSEDFANTYRWNLRRMRKFNDYQNVMTQDSYTEYTMLNDELCCFQFQPVSGAWGDEDNPRDYRPTSNDVQLNYYYPTNNSSTFKLIDNDESLIKQYFQGVSFSGTTHLPQTESNRVGITRPIISKYKTIINIKNGYKFVVYGFSTDKVGNPVVFDTGWRTEEFIVPENTYFTFVIAKANDENLQDAINIDENIIISSFPTINQLEDIIESGSGSYYYNGVDLDLKVEHTFDVEPLMDFEYVSSSSQGFAIYNNYLCQLYAGNGGAIQIQNLTTKEQVGLITNVGFNHGDCCQFSNKKYDENDLFPLLYVTSDTTPSIIHIVRIQSLSSAIIIKKYQLDNEAGYYAGHCFDFYNNYAYSFGYSEESALVSDNNNHLIISKYDLSQETLISGIIYSPTLLERKTYPFLYCLQGQKFLNDVCYLVSSLNHNVQPTKIYCYNFEQNKVVSVFENFPKDILNSEIEDIDFISNGNYYDIVIGNRKTYQKIIIK